MKKSKLEVMSHWKVITMILVGIIVLVGPSLFVLAEETQSKEAVEAVLKEGKRYINIENTWCYYTDSETDAGSYVRQMLEEHASSIKLAFGLAGNTSEDTVWDRIESTSYSGARNAEYLKMSIYDMELIIVNTDKVIKETNKQLIYFECRPSYYITLEEEKLLNNKVHDIVSSLSLKGLSDYGKTKKIYHYICHNVGRVTPGYQGFENSCLSAYGAIINKKASSQGFALLFYRLGMEAGLEVEIQCGIASRENDCAWNVIKIGGSYYYVDTALDSQYSENSNTESQDFKYYYFLKGSETFLDDHEQESGYKGIMSVNDYIITGKDRIWYDSEYEPLVEIIDLSGVSKRIAAGKKIKLTASFFPDYAKNKNLKWKSSNKKIASVTSDGKVKIKKGTGGKEVTITATAKDGAGAEAVYKIKVMKGVVKKIKIKGKKSVQSGKKIKLKTIVTASKGANKKLKWTSSNKDFATVSQKGVVKTKATGKGNTVKITAKATDGSGKKDTITISIK